MAILNTHTSDDHFMSAIRKALAYADSGKAKYANHEDVKKWASSWGTKNELQRPPTFPWSA
jgi:predicted transcriptional regulator